MEKQAKNSTKHDNEATMSAIELAQLGGGKIAYIKIMSSEEAEKLFPSVDGLPEGINLFALNGADGTPIALTDSWDSALGHAIEGDLAVAHLH